MKIFKRIAIALVLIVIVCLTFVIIKSIAFDEKIDLREKTLSELKYFESKLVNMFNLLNDIEFENYQIGISDVSEKSKKSTGNNENDSAKSEEKSGGEQEESSDSGSGGEGQAESQQEGQNSEQDSSSNEQKDKKYSLNAKGVLNSDGKIQWDKIKFDAEILENSMSSIMLDMYELSLNNIDVVNFTKEYDNLLVNIKNEDKEKTMSSLNILYSYLPRFVKNCDKDKQYEIIIDTKQRIFAAYSILDSNNWELIEKSIDEAIDIYSKLLTDININSTNQYIINKCYLTLNGIKNSINLKDKEIFLIKYKNILEDFNSL